MKKSSTKPTMPRNTAAKKRERSVSGLRTKMSELGVELDTENPNVRPRPRLLILFLVEGGFGGGLRCWRSGGYLFILTLFL